MPNPATPTDLEARWRPLDTQEEINGVTFLADAWGMLKRRINGLEAKVGTDPEYAAEVIRVMATAVLRVLKNPDGTRRESIDDHTWERDEAVSAGELYFSDSELDDLNPGTKRKGGAYSLDPFAGRDWSDWS